ncbi:putative 37S ribosomal protein S26A, mitochondrial [Schizosaccharomyces pombe]|uniref:Small ribosomal subunit protein mS43 n=1 Tax=Schizosaccharomyces pombe (strain 972 / ATCC 24843) TaxID=284812 RepID=RT01_SCHPO|nr:putative mitochondrial ribosomal protein subunit S26 [Schizosaccharomyces pombe]O42919.3 RecName: Full=Small ribosomal subunit protein mS43; AltName: Full=37S ribosomal protein S26A, mitochondrial; Flags: Precursor [Schizosaccharomyces pombe 972h-]CAA16865.3 mitochondrial ribosomal protein subunit S26 (predicted) [Schizosaccharomyces pombe]|eukprot:NP_596775.2 putative mitochondrial ribosomal protein subunit S26 [Schizosaccharomyces pombe]
MLNTGLRKGLALSPITHLLKRCSSVTDNVHRVNYCYNYHTVPNLSQRNLLPLFSPEALDIAWDQHQRQVVKELNDRVKGTELEDSSVFNIIFQTAALPEHAATFQFASQAYNNHFFFQSLIGKRAADAKKNSKYEANAAINKAVNENFGSKENLLSKIHELASNSFGACWLWIVIDDYNRLNLLRTFQAGSPYLWTRWQSNDPHLISSVPDYSARPRKYAHVPILNLCLWNHAYYKDYGLLNRSRYIDTWFDCIDWSVIEERLTNSLV